DDRTTLYFCPSRNIRCDSICHDWIRVECEETLLVYIFYVFHILLLHLLWNDGCGSNTKPPYWFHSGCCFLWNMERLFRICHSSY
ncbi:hypothetical protein HN873_003598, partial [Arachis hypogaea]